MLPSRSRGARRGAHPTPPRLTNADYDALYVAMREQMPRVTRRMFPVALQHLAARGVLEITATADEIVVWMPGVPEVGKYRARRNHNRARNRNSVKRKAPQLEQRTDR